MKHLLLLPLLSIFILQGNGTFRRDEKGMRSAALLSRVDDLPNGKGLSLQPEPGNEKMSAAAFRQQEFCYTELKDFVFDVHFDVISADVYFTGTNFRGTEMGTIKGSSLKPLSKLMARCLPGSIVIFDNVKVKGPDNLVRTIAGLTIMLH